MTNKPVLLTGRAALEHAGAERFQAQWKALYDRCAWSTVCQHPDFVLPWYALYGSRFVPVLVLEYAADGALAALLPLALHANGRGLSGAGDLQAEYQCWLQAPDTDGRFILRAVRCLQERFAHADLCLKYLPADISLGGIDASCEFGGNCVWRRYRRPLMRIEPGAMDRQRSKKNHRQNFNRLSRLGEVRFQHVTEPEQFAHIVGELCHQYDFRQAALFRERVFAQDAAKRQFNLELHRRGLLHAAILTVGKDIAASHFGLMTPGRAVHLGIMTHDPAWAAHSPGILLLAMLGVHLVEEKLPLFDLTPGGDSYKEHFASEHDSVLELVIYANAARRWQTQLLTSLVDFSRQRLRKAGIDMLDVKAWLMHLRERRWPPSASRWWDKMRPASRAPVLRYAGAAPAAAGSLPVSKNRLLDIVGFDAEGSAASYSAFMCTVKKRMERCQHLYTFMQDGVLAMACWVSTQAAGGEAPGDRQAGSPAARTVVLSDLYLHRRCEGSALVGRFIETILHEVVDQQKSEVVYRGAVSTQLKATLVRCGFVDAGVEASGGRASRSVPGVSINRP